MKRSQFLKAMGATALSLGAHRATFAVLPPPPLVDVATVVPELSPAQKRWALAVGAVLAEMNQRDHRVVGDPHRSPATVQAGLSNLAKAWGIHSRGDLQRRLDYFLSQGATAVFNRFAKEVIGAGPNKAKQLKLVNAGNPQVVHQIDLLERFYPSLGAKSLRGFDLARYVMLCRAAYNADYFSEAQVWELIYPQALEVQKIFASWMELGNNYIIGTSFISFSEYNKDKSLLEDTLRHLSTDANSPWVQLPWNLDLSRTGT